MNEWATSPTETKISHSTNQSWALEDNTIHLECKARLEALWAHGLTIICLWIQTESKWGSYHISITNQWLWSTLLWSKLILTHNHLKIELKINQVDKILHKRGLDLNLSIIALTARISKGQPTTTPPVLDPSPWKTCKAINLIQEALTGRMCNQIFSRLRSLPGAQISGWSRTLTVITLRLKIHRELKTNKLLAKKTLTTWKAWWRSKLVPPAATNTQG